MNASTEFWSRLLSGVTSDDIDQAVHAAAAAETRRALAAYDTGTVSVAASVVLRAITRSLRPRTAIEVGTFIGTSTDAIQSDRIYTCDKDNDCVPSTQRIRAFPKTRSTMMLKRLVVAREHAEFFFFDGRIQDEDLVLIERLSTPTTVYAFDDYEWNHKGSPEKGVINVDKLRPRLTPAYELFTPPEEVCGLPQKTTIAVLAKPWVFL
jgi:predicted O-methyltransferase YrrM